MLGLPCSFHFFPSVLGHLYEPTAGRPLRLRDWGPPGAVGGVMVVILAELTSTKPTVEALLSHSPSLFPNLVIHPAIYLSFYPSTVTDTILNNLPKFAHTLIFSPVSPSIYPPVPHLFIHPSHICPSIHPCKHSSIQASIPQPPNHPFL